MPHGVTSSQAYQPSPQNRRPSGFTLIELLVVISIIALLIAILLPVLGSARGAVYTTQCLSNQKQIMAGWSSAMAENKGMIPNIMPTSDPNRVYWYELLARQYPGIQKLRSSDAPDTSNPFLCPKIEASFSRPFYGPRYFGFAVNARWSDCGSLGQNELLPWAAIPQPSKYPWFADPAVRGTGSYVTGREFGDVNDPDSGLGFYHSGESGNAVFADGHAETNTADVLDEVSPDCETPRWLLAE